MPSCGSSPCSIPLVVVCVVCFMHYLIFQKKEVLMASQTGSTSHPLAEKSQEGAHIIARQDRIPGWSFPYLFIFIIGLGFLFMFYDIFDINVSFIQTCTQIVPGCTPVTAPGYLGL